MDKNKIEALLAETRQMPEMTIYNNRNCRFCIGRKTLRVFTRDFTGRWNMVSEVNHNLAPLSGTLLLLGMRTFLWSSGDCYELEDVHFANYSDKSCVSMLDEYTVGKWQWKKVDQEMVVCGYLIATGRDPLNTSVTDRETRASQKEDALRELISDRWISKLPQGETWSKAQEVYKYESDLEEIEYEEEKAVREAKRKAEREQKRQELQGKKSHVTAGLLAIFLGCVGAHKFYMGRNILGIIYLLAITSGVSALLGVYEGILYLRDSQEKFIDRIINKEYIPLP